MNCYLHVHNAMYLLNCARVPFLIFLTVGRGLTMFMFSKLVSNWWIWQGNMESKALLASKIFRTYIHMYAWIFVLQVMLYVFLPLRSCRVLISQKGVPQITRYMYSTAYVFCPHYSGKKNWKRNYYNYCSFRFVFEKNSGLEITSASWCHRSRKTIF